jgi:hypothetical protein
MSISLNKRNVLKTIVSNAYQLRKLGIVSGLNDRNFIPLCIAFGVDVKGAFISNERLLPFTLRDFDKVATNSGYSWDELAQIPDNYCSTKCSEKQSEYVKDETDDCICDVVFELLALASDKCSSYASAGERQIKSYIPWRLF